MERRFPIRQILIAAAVPPVVVGALYALSTIGHGHRRCCSRDYKIERRLSMIIDVAELIRVETGSYPASIAAMVDAKDPSGVPLMGSLDEIPTDAWGRDFEYRLVDGKPWVRCLGADGTLGGEGEAADTVRTPEGS